jgi:hypothetical protein
MQLDELRHSITALTGDVRKVSDLPKPAVTAARSVFAGRSIELLWQVGDLPHSND